MTSEFYTGVAASLAAEAVLALCILVARRFKPLKEWDPLLRNFTLSWVLAVPPVLLAFDALRNSAAAQLLFFMGSAALWFYILLVALGLILGRGPLLGRRLTRQSRSNGESEERSQVQDPGSHTEKEDWRRQLRAGVHVWCFAIGGWWLGVIVGGFA